MNQVRDNSSSAYSPWVSRWLLLGLVLIAGQILIGGITRLTGSGLSITKWEIVTGTLPPMSDADWNHAFALYQDTPQYRLINKGMSLDEFRYIYFWEYLHRLWARLMGLLFAVPFLWFWMKGLMPAWLRMKLLVLVGLAAITASFGWIMVASGLIERPWVNAYKLGIHLLLGFSVFLWCYHSWYSYRVRTLDVTFLPVLGHPGLKWFMLLAAVQVFIGGLLSGMRAGFAFPTWPDYHGSWMPSILLDPGHWRISAFVDYDDTEFMAALVQFLHRNLAYLILLYGSVLCVSMYRRTRDRLQGRRWIFTLLLVLCMQVFLGVLTVVGFRSGMPVSLASVHQMVGLLVVTVIFHGWMHQGIQSYKIVGD